MRRKGCCLALTAVLGVSSVLAGCGISSGGKGTLKVGVRADVINFGFQNPDTGRYYGLEIDIADEMADRMGYQDVEYVTVLPETRKEMLLNGEVDCLVACYSITDTRTVNFDFSPAYYTDITSIMVENSSLISSVDDMKDKTIGVMAGANAGPLLAIKFKDLGIIADDDLNDTDESTQYNGLFVKKIESYQALSDALEEGTIDGACMDGSIAGTYMNEDRSLLDVNVAEQDYGVATQKDSELSAAVSETIQEMLDDGTIDTMIDKWN